MQAIGRFGFLLAAFNKASFLDSIKPKKGQTNNAHRIFSEIFKQFVNKKCKKIKSEISSGLRFLKDKISKIFHRIFFQDKAKPESEIDIVERIFAEKLKDLISKGKIKDGQPVVVKLSRRKYTDLPYLEKFENTTLSAGRRFNSKTYRGISFPLQPTSFFLERCSCFVIKEPGKKQIRILQQYHKTSGKSSIIGEGAFKIIYKLRCLKTNKITDVRAVVKPDVPSVKAAIKAFEEFRDDPNLCTGYHLTYKSKKSFEKKDVFLSPIMESDLSKLKGTLDKKMQFMAMEQICKAIKTMHDKDWIHGDIKTDNCFASCDFETYTIDVKLGDFDLAKKATHDGRIFYEYGEGCLQYMAPELFGNCNCISKIMKVMGIGDSRITDSSDESIEPESYSSEGIAVEKAKRCDIYALGIVFFEISERLSSKLHLSNSISLGAIVISCYNDLYDRGFPKPGRQTLMQALIYKMINPDSKLRPTIDEVISELETIHN